METMSCQQHNNSCGFVSRKRQAAFASVQDNYEVKRLCRLNKDSGGQVQWISENITNCEREHMVCDVNPMNEVTDMETSDSSHILAPHTCLNDRAQTKESINISVQSQQLVSHQRSTLPVSHFMGQLGTQKVPRQTTSCSRCRAGQPGHIHHICSF